MYGARPLPGEETRPLPYWQNNSFLPDIYSNKHFIRPLYTSATYESSKRLPTIGSNIHRNPYSYPYICPAIINNNASTNNCGSTGSVFHTVFWGIIID